MNWLLSIMILCSATQCSTYQGSHQSHKRHDTTSAKTSSPKPPLVIAGNHTGILVSADWLRKYRLLEDKHGTVDEDALIYMEGEQYRIPQEVADHFNDMVRIGAR